MADRKVAEYGSLDGVLEYLSMGNKRYTAQLHPLVGGEIVLVHFSEELLEDMRRGLRQTVNISGLLISDADYRVQDLYAEEVTILEFEEPTVSARGIWSGLREQGYTVEDLMRGIRGDDWGR